MKPKAWQALVLAIALVLSVREVALAMYDRTTATLPKKDKNYLHKCKEIILQSQAVQFFFLMYQTTSLLKVLTAFPTQESV